MVFLGIIPLFNFRIGVFTMYAIFESGGKQYRVEEGDLVSVELLNEEQGASVTFGQVLFVFDGKDNHVGAPASNFTIKGEIVGNTTGPKIKSIKYKKRKQEYRRFGHRQHYSQVKITGINSNKR
jgi:large subunit ribosomal protein L21